MIRIFESSKCQISGSKNSIIFQNPPKKHVWIILRRKVYKLRTLNIEIMVFIPANFSDLVRRVQFALIAFAL